MQTVLVIEDDQNTAALVTLYLEREGFRTLTAGDGPAGLALARRHQPNLVILDLMLPEMDGWELLQRLKNHPQTNEIPVVMCSVLDSPELAYSLGAALFLPKPVSRDDVLSALSQLGVV